MGNTPIHDLLVEVAAADIHVMQCKARKPAYMETDFIVLYLKS